MRILLYVGTVILLLLSACELNQQTINTEKSVNSEQETNTANDSLTNRDQVNQNIDGFLAALQGEWKRTTYPYGTVEFVGNEVKYISEGMAESPQFEPFRLSDTCPYSTDQEQIAAYPFFLVREKNQTCSSIKLNNDFLVFGYQRSKSESIVEETVYASMPNRMPNGASTSGLDKTIPQSIHGKWAIGEENCGVCNYQQISIDDNSIQFFDNREEIGYVAQYTPTSIIVYIKHRLPDSDPYPYHSPTFFEAQENGKVLIAQQYAQDYPKTIQYERCK